MPMLRLQLVLLPQSGKNAMNAARRNKCLLAIYVCRQVTMP